MSDHLAQMTGKKGATIRGVIDELERIAGYPGEDNRLVSEIKATLRVKVGQLGLDPDDTTTKELHHAAVARFASDNQLFSKITGVDTDQALDKKTARLIRLAELNGAGADVWALKRTVVKDLFRQRPPKKLMRKLHYRSIDSLLKREDTDSLYLGVFYVESPSWLKNFFNLHSHLTPADFDWRPLKLIAMPAKDWQDYQTKHAVSYAPAIGAAALWPVSLKSRRFGLRSYLALLQATDILKVSSLALIMQQVKPDFGLRLRQQVEDGLESPASIGNAPIEWSYFHHFYGQQPKKASRLLAEPHLQSVNLHKLSISKILGRLHPSFRWWGDNDYIAAVDNQKPVSLNIDDMAESYTKGWLYHRRSHNHLSRSLWEELMTRYMKHSAVESHILSQLEENLVNNSSLGNRLQYAYAMEDKLQRT